VTLNSRKISKRDSLRNGSVRKALQWNWHRLTKVSYLYSLFANRADALISPVESITKITAPRFGTVWKIFCRTGDTITSDDMTVAILEAMKIEIPIKAGEANVGETVKRLSRGVCEGAGVGPGDPLIFLG
ncbi:hypothetical protein K438DRAFT_1834301, partial [Mycena galopus ATCC 62051]